VHTFRVDDGIAHVVLDDGKANVLNPALCAAVRGGIEAAAEARAGALVVHGRERMFSGGIDLGLVRESDPAIRATALQEVAHTMLALWTAPLPTVAAVTGHAIAGGAILAMACDRRIGTEGAFKVGINETRLRMVFPTWALVIAQAGIRREAWGATILEGDLVDPAAAVTQGILDEVVAADDHAARVAEVAAGLAEIPTRAYGGNKALLRGAEAARAGALVAAEMGGGFASDQIGT
jgi:enoyl-CoA hydratase